MARPGSSRHYIAAGAALLVGCACLTGCARSAASGWAQLAPAIRPLPASETTVLLGATSFDEHDADIHDPELKPLD